MATSPERKLKCPMCGHKSLGYNIEKKVGRCFRGTCGWTCNYITLERSLGYDPTYAIDGKVLTPHVVLSAEQEKFEAREVQDETWREGCTPYKFDSLASWSLLEDRKCWEGDIRNVLFCPRNNRLWFPIAPIGEEVPSLTAMQPSYFSFITRSVFRSQKGWRREAVMQDDCVFGELRKYFDGEKETLNIPYIILVEGVWDVLTPRMNGYALALLGTNMSKEQEAWLVRQQLPIVIWMDEDEAGLKATEEINDRLKGMVPTLRVFHEHEPGDCTPEEARWVIQNAMGKAWW